MENYSLILDYIKPELLVLAVALYFVGIGLKSSKIIRDEYIPVILGAAGIVFASIYVFATSPIGTVNDIMLTIFTSIVQGILCAAASVYLNQIIKQFEKAKSNSNNTDGNASGNGNGTN